MQEQPLRPEGASPALPERAPTDDEIIARVRSGEVDAFETIMRRYNQRLFRMARSIMRSDDEAEDVLQEAYFQAYTHLDGFEGRAKLSTWLTRIVVHEAYRRSRRERRHETLETETESALPPTPEQIAASREMARVLEGAIDGLPEDFRTVFVLRVVERLDVAATAECLGIQEATVKTRLHRARRLLQQAVEQQTHEALSLVHRFLGDRCDRIVARVLVRLRSEVSR